VQAHLCSDTAGAGPLVSIIVATYNRAAFLERCVRSILDQTYRHLECLVIDGASQDGSVAILERLAAADPRLRYVSEPDAGEVEAVNKGLDLARGQIVGFQASDDWYVPDAVETSVQFLRAHPEYVGVGGDARFVDPAGRPLHRGMITYRGELSPQGLRRLLLLRYFVCPVIHGTFFGWRERLLRHGKFDPAFSVCPDTEFYLRVLAGGDRLGCLPRVQVNYTLHPEMGAVRHYHRVRAQLAVLYRRHGLKWYHHAVRLTLGRVCTYWGNPYRSPFVSGLAREAREFWTMRLRRGT
jgi:glycosyltransferase involved in cell wall biosynthesis